MRKTLFAAILPVAGCLVAALVPLAASAQAYSGTPYGYANSGTQNYYMPQQQQYSYPSYNSYQTQPTYQVQYPYYTTANPPVYQSYPQNYLSYNYYNYYNYQPSYSYMPASAAMYNNSYYDYYYSPDAYVYSPSTVYWGGY